MRSLLAKALATSSLLAVSACSHAPNPVVARDPVPPPPAGYAVACGTTRLPLGIVRARCVPVQRVEPVVVRALY
jgi:hypothetical protein